MPQSFMLCPSCNTHRLMDAEQTCPSCEDAASALTQGRSKVIAAALGISLSLGAGVAACKPTPQAAHYGGPPIEALEPADGEFDEGSAEPVGGSEPDAAPDMTRALSADMMANVPLKGAPPVDIYGGPPVDRDEEQPLDTTTSKKETP